MPASGSVDVNWRDHALGYSGTLSWTPSTALLRVSVVDLQTRTQIGNYSVPGDSTTPGPHTHFSRLIFKAQNDGSIRLVQNCPRPGECY